ncbi:MAG: diguanylate cyclase, partial [Gammaproteobacteria bacterium]|nr:diguanylate cyclase [Gammaproteobacteria bacterium]
MKQTILSRQTDQLYLDSKPIFYLSFLVLGLYVIILHQVIPGEILLTWCICFKIAIILRGYSLYKFFTRGYKLFTAGTWRYIHVSISILHGLVQGSMVLMFDPAWATPDQITFWALVISVTAVSIKGYSVFYPTYAGFTLPVLLCAMTSLYLIGSPDYLELFWMCLIYGIGVHLTAYSAYKNINLGLINEDMLIAANRKLETLASRDPLTNLPNRRAFDDYYHSEWERHKRSASVLSLLVIDVDYFKQFNDTYGHAAGDNALIRLANCINECINRPADKVVRYGGEEFVVLLPDTAMSGSIEVAERILKKVRGLKIPHESSTISDVLTVSIGVATTDPTEDKDEKE